MLASLFKRISAFFSHVKSMSRDNIFCNWFRKLWWSVFTNLSFNGNSSLKYFLYFTVTLFHSDTVMSILSYFNSSRNSNLNILKGSLVLLYLFNFHCYFLLSCTVYFYPINTDITNRAALFYIYYFSSFAFKNVYIPWIGRINERTIPFCHIVAMI